MRAKTFLTLKDKTYNFYEMIEEQARLCLLNIREKDIVFTVRFLDRFPEQVSGDYLRVAQIFQNILSNACKFTEQGTITLSLHCKMEEGQVWCTGICGICFVLRGYGGRGLWPGSVNCQTARRNDAWLGKSRE